MGITPSSKIWGERVLGETKEKDWGTPRAKASHTGYMIQLVHIKHTKTCSTRGIYKPKRIISICYTVPKVTFFLFVTIILILYLSLFSRDLPYEINMLYSPGRGKKGSFHHGPCPWECFVSYVQTKKYNNFKIRKLSCESSEKHKQC